MDDKSLLTRACLLAAVRGGDSQKGHGLSEELRGLSCLAHEFPMGVMPIKFAKATSRKGKVGTKSVRTLKSRVKNLLVPLLSGTIYKYDDPKNVRLVRRVEEEGIACDALFFPFQKVYDFTNNVGLDKITINWKPEEDCPSNCSLRTNGHCTGTERMFESTIKSTADLKPPRFNQHLLRLLEMKPVHTSITHDPALAGLNFVTCKSDYVEFKRLNYEEKSSENRPSRHTFESPFASPLGVTIFVVRVNDQGNPIEMALSLRKRKQQDGSGQLLQVGFGQYDTGASSQVKLPTPGSVFAHHGESDDTWATPLLKKAVLSETFLESGVAQNDVNKAEVLALGWIPARSHYEILVRVETKTALPTTTSNLEHGDEFSRKLVVPFRSDDLCSIARYLVGFAPDDQGGNFVEWLPEAAACVILAADRYGFKQELEQAVSRVIDEEIATMVTNAQALRNLIKTGATG